MSDELSDLHDELDRARWKVDYTSRLSKEVEKHYRARLVRRLEALGIGPVEIAGANDPIDLVVAGWPVELKVSRATVKEKGGYKREYYQALLHDPGNRHHLNGSILILLCVDRQDELWPFVIPSLFLGARRTVEITSHPAEYGGQWAEWLKAWDLFSIENNQGGG